MNWRLLGTVLTSSGGTSQTTVQSLNFSSYLIALGWRCLLNSRLKQRTTFLWTAYLNHAHFFWILWIIRHHRLIKRSCSGCGKSLDVTFVLPGLFPPLGHHRAKNGTSLCTNPFSCVEYCYVPRWKIVWQAFINNVGGYYLTGKP